MTSLHTNPNQYRHVSIYKYIEYKHVCIYIYICIHTPINYNFFDSLIFQNTRLLPSKICSPRAQSGPPSKRVPTETRHHVQLKCAAVVGQSNIDVEHHHELIGKNTISMGQCSSFFLVKPGGSSHGW